MRKLATLNHEKACDLVDRLEAVDGVTLETPTFFNEFTVSLTKPAAEVVEVLATKDILAGVPVSRLMPGQGHDDKLIIAVTETVTESDMDALVYGLKEVL